MKAACCGMILVVASFFLGTAPAHAILVTVEADDFALGTDLSTAVAGVTLSAFSGPPIVGAGDPLLSSKVLSSHSESLFSLPLDHRRPGVWE
jgi:hypothetical protein